MKPQLRVRWIRVSRRNDILLHALERDFAVEESDDAQVIFFGDGVRVPADASPGAVTFFVPTELHWPPLARCDYCFGFLHLRMPRYHRLPNYVLEYPAQALIKDADFVDRVMAEPRDFCSFVVSNGNPRRTFARIYFFQALDSKRRVTSGGKLFNNTGPLAPGTDALDGLVRRHRFHIAMENKAWRGYATEKITAAMAAGTIPLYWGDPHIAADFNPASFVHLRDYRHLLEARDAVLRTADDRDALVRLLREPWFHGNRPNAAYAIEPLADFLKRSITAGQQSKRRWFPVTWAHKGIEKLAGRIGNIAHRMQTPPLT
jgi:hypothetical protein